MNDCIFCKIIAGTIPSSTVYEDDQVLAFMDIQPVHEGQLLVIPKQHTDHFSDLPEELAVRVFVQAHRLSNRLRAVTTCERVGLIVHGYGVPHAHMIVLPQYQSDDITSARMAAIEAGKVVFTMDALPVLDRKVLDSLAEKIRNA